MARVLTPAQFFAAMKEPPLRYEDWLDLKETFGAYAAVVEAARKASKEIGGLTVLSSLLSSTDKKYIQARIITLDAALAAIPEEPQ